MRWRDRAAAALLRARQPADPAHVRVQAALVAAAAGVELLLPLPVDQPGVSAAAVVGPLVVAGLYWVLAPRFQVWALHLVLVAGLAAGLGGVATSADAVHASATSATLLWTGLLAAAISSPPVARAYAAFIAVGLGGALVAAGVEATVQLAVVYGGTAVVAVEVLNRYAVRLRHAATTDPLTGLVNRNGLADAGARAIAMCRRAGAPLSVAVLDLDGFKEINDVDGHAAGDRLLARSAAAWREIVRAGDVLARSGGDEFVLLMPATDLAAAERLLDRLASASPVPWSHGLVELGPDEPLPAALDRADAELVRHKVARGRVRPALRVRRAPRPRPT